MTTYEHTDGFWIGRLSMALACAIARKDAHVGREALEDFMRSPLPSSELRDMLRKEIGR